MSQGKGSTQRPAAISREEWEVNYAKTYPNAAQEAGTFAKCELCGTVHRVWVAPKPEYFPGAVFFPVVLDYERRKYCPTTEVPDAE